RSRRIEGPSHRRRVGVADARQFHRQRGFGDGCRRPRARRTVQARGASAVRRESSRGDCVSRRLELIAGPHEAEHHGNLKTTKGFMSTLLIEGGPRLSGSVSVEGNKNSALPLLAACLLTTEECVLTNVPRISDVEVMARLLLDLGAEIEGIGS